MEAQNEHTPSSRVTIDDVIGLSNHQSSKEEETHTNQRQEPSNSKQTGTALPVEEKAEDLTSEMEFTHVVKEEEMDSLVQPQQGSTMGKGMAKAVAFKALETFLPYGLGCGALAATEGSAAAAEFTAAHLAALRVSCGAFLAVVRLYFYVVGGAVAVGAVVGVGGGLCYGVHQVMLDRNDQPLQLDEEEKAALEAACNLNLARAQGQIDLNVTASRMSDHEKHSNVQVAGCLDLIVINKTNVSSILESGVVEATIRAMEIHWDEEEVLRKGSEALAALFYACSEEESTTLQELGAHDAIEKARESLNGL